MEEIGKKRASSTIGRQRREGVFLSFGEIGTNDKPVFEPCPLLRQGNIEFLYFSRGPSKRVQS
jgi:hypothetical protein